MRNGISENYQLLESIHARLYRGSDINQRVRPTVVLRILLQDLFTICSLILSLLDYAFRSFFFSDLSHRLALTIF